MNLWLTLFMLFLTVDCAFCCDVKVEIIRDKCCFKPEERGLIIANYIGSETVENIIWYCEDQNKTKNASVKITSDCDKQLDKEFLANTSFHCRDKTSFSMTLKSGIDDVSIQCGAIFSLQNQTTRWQVAEGFVIVGCDFLISGSEMQCAVWIIAFLGSVSATLNLWLW